MKDPLISIIVPVYQVEKYLDECVQSIVNQTYKNLEIILVNDGSKDSCPAKCDAWAQKDSRIKVIHKENGGLSSARNAGLDIAAGDYIGFVDSDDFISHSMYMSLLSVLQKTGCKIAGCKSTRKRNELGCNTDTKEAVILSATEAINEFFYHGIVSDAIWDKLYSRELFDQLRFPVGETNEEAKMMLPLLLQAQSIVYLNGKMHFYRETEGSITSSTWKTNADIVLKNMNAVGAQIKQYNLQQCSKAFDEYCAVVSYCVALHLDKHYEKINATAKENQKKYITIMRKKLLSAMRSTRMLTKDKILYVMVITRTLRLIYTALGRL